ncbi:6501_t:CDS:2, partial [Dentiscutata erythropus]
MPPKKALLYCLLHGEPVKSCFGIKYDKNTTIDELRKVIWKQEVEGRGHVKPRNLDLYQLLYPTNNVEEKFPAPANDHIHIIIDVPVVAKATLETTEGELSYKWAIEQIANILDRQTKRLKVSLSNMNQTYLDELLNHFNFRRGTSAIIVNSTNKNFDKQFVDNISISLTLVWYDSKSKKDLLNVNIASLPYNISGTTDVLVIDESFYSIYNYHGRIRAGFVLKKTVQDPDINQAIAELIVANIHSNYAVFLVLTDLNNNWVFYWFSNDKTIMMFRATNSSNAFDIIERALTKDSTSMTIDPNFPIGVRINCFHHLENLQGGASENKMESLDLFFNRPKVQFEFELDVANMKDMFDEMTEEEIKDWK